MAIDFPTSPAVGQRYSYAGINYIYTSQGIWSVTSLGGPATSTSFVTVRSFTASGTYTPTPGTQFAIVECIGGGGAGGPANANASTSFQGGGGGSGGYSRSCLTAAQIGGGQPITIGAGGIAAATNPGNAGSATGFGGLCVANGGSGGGWANPGTNPYGGQGGVPGVGDIAVAGTPGGFGYFYSAGTNPYIMDGSGGHGPLGGGSVTGITLPGQTGTGYGAGGSGGSAHATVNTIIGGSGAPGICIVTEFNITAAGPQGPVGPQGGTVGASPPQGRLTLQSNTPVMTTSRPTQSVIYYTPYTGDKIPIYDGSVWTMTTFAELSCVTTDTTKNPSAIGASKVNDWFVWNNAGTMRLSHGVDWPNDTGRFGPSGIVRINGLWVNGADITNGPAAGRGTYIGTTRSNATSTIDWKYGTLASTGGASFFGVWNTYNRVDVASMVGDLDGSTAFSATSFVAHPAGMRHTFVSGLAEDVFEFIYHATVTVGGSFVSASIGYDTGSAFSGNAGYLPASVTDDPNASYRTTAVGCHYACSIVMSYSGAAATLIGNSGQPGSIQTGLWFKGKM